MIAKNTFQQSGAVTPLDTDARTLEGSTKAEVIASAVAQAEVGGAKNFITNPLVSNNLAGWTRNTGTPLAWNTTYPIVGGGAVVASGFASTHNIEGTLNTVNPSDGGQSWKIELGYYIDAGATFVEGDLQLVLLDGSTEIQGGNIPIVLGQVSKTTVFVYPSTTLTGLKVRIKCITGHARTGTLRIGDVTVAPQQIMMVPAIGPRTGISLVLTNFGNASQVSTYRRNGEFMLIESQITIGSTPPSGQLQVTLPAPFTLFEGSPCTGVVYGKDVGINNYTGTVYKYAATNALLFVANNTGSWTNTIPFTWGTGDTIEFSLAIPIAQWSTSVQVSGESVEYASNSNSTASDDLVSYSYGPAGELIPNIPGTGSNLVVNKQVKLQSPFKSGDSLQLEGYLTAWGNETRLNFNNRIKQGLTFYGAWFETNVDGNPYLVKVYFGGGGYQAGDTLGSTEFPWSALSASGWRWRVVKRSGGSLAEVPPVVRAEYTGSTAIVPPTLPTFTTMNFATKVEDTHNAVSTPDTNWTFTVPISGIYQIEIIGISASASNTADTRIYYRQKGSIARTIAKFHCRNNVGGVEGAGMTSVRMLQGQTIAVEWGSEVATTGDITSRRITITRIGS